MSLPIYQTNNKDISMLQTNWAQQLNPVIELPPNQGLLLKDVPLIMGTNVINHKLSRKPQGYIITGMHNTFSEIYDITSANPTLTLVLNSSAATTVDLWVF